MNILLSSIRFLFNKNVVDYICDKAASEKMGARPLKRLIHSHIEDKIVDFYFKKPTDLDTKFNFLIEDDEIIFNLT